MTASSLVLPVLITPTSQVNTTQDRSMNQHDLPSSPVHACYQTLPSYSLSHDRGFPKLHQESTIMEK